VLVSFQDYNPYAAVAARTAEIATLRAIGFGPSGVVVSALAEALVLSLVGALIGAAVAWLLFNGSALTTGGGEFGSDIFSGCSSGRVSSLWASYGLAG